MRTLAIVLISLILSACVGFGKPPPISVLPEAPASMMVKCPALEVLAKGGTPEDALLVVSKNYEAYNACKIVVDEWITFYSNIKKQELK